MKTITLPALIALTLAFFALSPQARATCQKGCDTVNLDTFLGEDALSNNTTGHNNTAIGYKALISNTVGSQNTAIGTNALYSSPYGNSNTAVGNAALFSDTYGVNNVAIGSSALYSNTTGYQNTATGTVALHTNTTGYNNTANGFFALQSNTSGNSNAADGFNALYGNTTGNNNIALGFQAGQNLTTGDNNIDIGNVGMSGESNTIRIGTGGSHTATYIAGINGAPLVHGAAVAVGITADGQLGFRASSARFKELVKPMEKASEAIFSLQPVTFRYKKDPAALPQFGLVAEEVAKVSPDLVTPDVEGKPFTVRYDEINAMLLNEFLKEHRKVEALQESFAQQQSDFRATVAQQQKQLDALAAGLQKVSAQLEATKPAPQTLADNH